MSERQGWQIRIEAWATRSRRALHALFGVALRYRGWTAMVFAAPAVILVIAWITIDRQQASSVFAPEEISLESAIAKLENGAIDDARRIAVLLHAKQQLPYEQRGGPPYVIGRAIQEDPGADANQRSSYEHHVLASRYLREAYERGFPSGHRQRGLRAYAESLMATGRYDDAVPVLRDGLMASGGATPGVSRMLSAALARCSHFDGDAALRHVNLYLNSTSASPEQRAAAWLDRIRIFLRQGNLTAAREAFERLPQTTIGALPTTILHARLLLAEGDGARESSTTDDTLTPLARQYYERGLQVLVPLRSDPACPREEAAAAFYLSGHLHSRLGEYDKALTCFADVCQRYSGSTFAFAARFERAERLLIMKEFEDALDEYRHLAQAGPRWFDSELGLSDAQLLSRITLSIRELQADGKHAVAVALCDASESALSVEESLLAKAEALTCWGDHLAEAADGETSQRQKPLAWSKYRRAGRCYRALAQRHFSTRRYTQDLWSSAEAYEQGHAYAEAAEAYSEYLRREPERRRPLALSRTARCSLNGGEYRQAIAHARECLQAFPLHPEVHDVRIVAALAHREMEDYKSARTLLEENLYGVSNEITPDSLAWRESLFRLGETLYLKAMRLTPEVRTDGIQQHGGVASGPQALPATPDETTLETSIVKLREFVTRYPRAPHTHLAHYMLARAHAQLGHRRRQDVPTVRDEVARLKLQNEMRGHLQASKRFYKEVWGGLRDRQAQGLTRVEAALLRNSMFALAAREFDLGNNERALKGYALAAIRFEDEPAVLEAYARLASCHWSRNESEAARSQLRRAEVALQRFAENVEFQSTTRYSRAEWARTLRWMTSL